MDSRNLAALAALIVGFVAAPGAEAAVVTWQATGVVSEVDNSEGLLPFAVALGDTFTMTYSFETTTPDRAVDVQHGIYFNVTSMVFASGVNTFVYAIPPLNYEQTLIGNDLPISGTGLDSYTVEADSDHPQVGNSFFGFLNMTKVLAGEPGGPLSSDALPTSPPSPSDFDSAFFRLTAAFTDNNNHTVSDEFTAQMTSLEVVPEPVPLPATVWLMLSALGAAVRFVRWKA